MWPHLSRMTKYELRLAILRTIGQPAIRAEFEAELARRGVRV